MDRNVDVVPAGALITIRYLKWPNSPHYKYRMRVLGEDDHGVWGSCDIGEEVYKEDRLAYIREFAYLGLVPRAGCWSALWYPPSDAELELYVDINTEPRWESRSVSMIDLDFDVVRRRDGTVDLVDEDEFEEHRRVRAYPEDIVTLARGAAADLFVRVDEPAEPFRTAWKSWYQRCFPQMM